MRLQDPDQQNEKQQFILEATPETMAQIKVGDKVKFFPSVSTGERWWTVQSRDERFIVAVMQRPFHTSKDALYTVVDITGWENQRYNDAGEGVVRSSLDTLGGGWSGVSLEDPTAAREALQAVNTGERELSYRRMVNVRAFEVRR